MPKLIQDIHKKLLTKKYTVAAAESCTGGMLSENLTSISGSSKYFKGAVIAYSDDFKVSFLKIPKNIIKIYGSVSKQAAILLAKNIRKRAKTDFGISITGIAGPTGATPHKPVGLVYVAVAAKNKVMIKKLNFQGSRIKIRQKAVSAALSLLNLCLKD